MINYALVAMNLLVCIKVLVIHNHNNSNINSVLDKFYRHATRAFAFVVAFQIVLCLILGCSGISIVWCSMAGWIMSQKRQMILSLDENDEDDDENDDEHHHHHRHDSTAGSSGMTHEKLAKMAQWAILLDLGALVYYSVVSEIITTIAHGCALVMGACLSQLVNKHSGVITTTRTITNGSSETTHGTNEEPLLETTNQGERR
ncbi:unnamed protein product [Cylindrotheca closterium]|uniref:Uncharacterized protein n=1 Tax=Cylindrotheca closterium TaxID=2856 RepID=A0AAD2PVR6_9STRA|nr:unnamed protein product [Cylindrotheca closterium]